METRKVFSATLGPRERLVTYAVGIGVGLGVPIVLGAVLGLAFRSPVLFLLPLPFGGLVLVIFSLHPIGFSVDGRKLEILRPVGALPISLAGLMTIDHPASLPPVSAIGLVASHGFFGVFGLFWNRRWGRYHQFVTDSNKQVMLAWRDGKKVVLSPDEPHRFVESIQAAIVENGT